MTPPHCDAIPMQHHLSSSIWLTTAQQKKVTSVCNRGAGKADTSIAAASATVSQPGMHRATIFHLGI